MISKWSLLEAFMIWHNHTVKTWCVICLEIKDEPDRNWHYILFQLSISGHLQLDECWENYKVQKIQYGLFLFGNSLIQYKHTSLCFDSYFRIACFKAGHLPFHFCNCFVRLFWTLWTVWFLFENSICWHLCRTEGAVMSTSQAAFWFS